MIKALTLLLLLLTALPLQAQQHGSTNKIQKMWLSGNKNLEAERYSEAIKDFDALVTILRSPNELSKPRLLAAVYNRRAAAYYGAEKWPLAVADYSRCLGITPNDANALAFRGIARKATGDYDGMIEDVGKAAKIDPNYEEMLDNARSTVLFRKVYLGVACLVGFVVICAGIPLFRGLVRLVRAGV